MARLVATGELTYTYRMHPPIEKDTAQFLLHLKEKRYSSLTIDHYRQHIEFFVQRTGIPQSDAITASEIEKFKHHLDRKGLAPSTKNYYLIAIRNFIRWLPEKRKQLSHRAITLYHTPVVHRTQPIQSEFIDQILAAPMKSPQRLTLAASRDTALLSLLLRDRFRPGEVIRLQSRHFDQKNAAILVVHAQGAPSPRALSRETADALKKYLTLRHDMNPFLFIAHDRAHTRRRSQHRYKQLSLRSVERMIEKYGHSLNLPVPITPRSIATARHIDTV